MTGPSSAFPPAQAAPPTTAIADVLALFGMEGCLSPPLQKFHASAEPVLGTACTVQLEPTDGTAPAFDELYELLSSDLSGRVLVLAGAERCVGAVWGEILSRAAKASGAAGALVAGAVRDVAALDTERLPVWGLSERTVGPAGTVRVGAINTTVRISDVVIAPHSLIIHDCAGVVALPPGDAVAARLLRHAAEYASAETQVLADLAAGARLVDAYRHKKHMLERLRERTEPVGESHA